MTWMGVRWESRDLDGSERIHGWRWGNILRLWIQVGLDQDGGEIYILKPGWVWDGVSMDLKYNCWYLAGGETSPGWRWDANIETWIEVSCDLDGCQVLTLLRVAMISFRLHPDDKSPPSKSQSLHPSSIQFQSQCHPGIIPLHVLSHQHLGSCLSSIHVSSDLNQCP